jgi:hypothetical protein
LFFPILKGESEFEEGTYKIISWLQLVESVRGYSSHKQN